MNASIAHVVAGALLALALTLPATAPAQVVDSDGDGFDDSTEAAGLVLDLGSEVVTYPPCAPGVVAGDPARDLCVDPASADLFVILVQGVPSNIPSTMDPLALLKKPSDQGGVGIGVHQITASQAGDDRTVSSSSTQKAARVTESLNTSGEVLGIATYGTPNGLDAAVVFSQRIANFVDGVCSGASSCKLSTGEVGAQAIIERYIQRTLNHEVGHMLQLTADYNSRFGGNHYKSGSGVVMEQSVKYTNKGGKVTFYVSTDFAQGDPTDAVLQ